MSTLLGKLLADFSTSLSTDISVGGTTATLSSATDDDGVALPSGRYFFTLDNSNSSKEHISCDLVGTALTNIKSVSRQGVETAGVVRKHRIGASVTLTDFGHIKFMNDLISGATQLNASAPLGYDGVPASLTGNQLATVTYVLGVVNGGTVAFDKQVISGQTAGENLTVNDIVYFKESDQRWWKADADLSSTFNQLQLGVAESTVSTGATLSIAISGPVGGFTGLTAGSKYYLSNTAGAISTTAGTTSVFIGWALNTTTIIFKPELNGALAGSQGVPSSSNKYVTQDNLSSATTDQTQTTQNSQSSVGEADTTGLRNDLAQSFIPTKTKIRGVNLYKSANTGTFTGTVTVTIQADTAGSPSGSALATKTFTNVEWSALPVGEFEAIFASEYASMVAGSLYWIVIETSTADTSNRPNIGINTAGGYANGSVKYKNTTDGWVAVATVDLYFKTLEGTASQVVKTNTSGKIENAFYDVSEMPIPAFQQQLGLPTADSLTGVEPAFGSTMNGDTLYVTLQSGVMSRYERDPITGQYFFTTSATVSTSSADENSVVPYGSHIYVFDNDGTNIRVTRYDGTTLGSSQSITVPTVASTSGVIVWTDGVFFYVVSEQSATTVRKWSLSGTTMSAVSTATCVSMASQSALFDGTTLYSVAFDTIASGPITITIKKYADILASATSSTTTKQVGILSEEKSMVGFVLNIGTSRMYAGAFTEAYDETALVGTMMHLFPVTKP